MGIRAIILGDIRLFREGLAGLLNRDPRVSVVATTGDFPAMLALLQSLQPDVVLLDMAMADSLGHAKALMASFPDLKIVALAVPETESDVIACAEAGATGYVPREASIEDLIVALESATRGELRCSARVAASLLRRVAELASVGSALSAAEHLTPRELDVLRLLDLGCSNKEIATELGIEVATAKNHVHNILEKLGVRRRAQAMAVARRWLPRRLWANAEKTGPFLGSS
jgi:two-component system nitrate/nitrite response regulator NarL